MVTFCFWFTVYNTSYLPAVLQMYVEFGGNVDDHNVVFTRSRLYRLLDRHQNTITLRVNVPKMSVNGLLIVAFITTSYVLLASIFISLIEHMVTGVYTHLHTCIAMVRVTHFFLTHCSCLFKCVIHLSCFQEVYSFESVFKLVYLLISVSLVCLAVGQRDGSLHNSVFTSAAVDRETTEADEGIGESETDIASSTDADVSCSSYCQNFSNVTSSTPPHSDQCDKPTEGTHTCNPVSALNVSPDDHNREQHSTNLSADDRGCLTDVTATEPWLESQDCDSEKLIFDAPESVSLNVDGQGSAEDPVEMTLLEDSGSSQTYDVLKSVTLNDDDPALSEDSGSSQTLSVTQSSSLNDDDQGSLTDVTETPHSEGSGSSRTVEVGDDDVPQLLDDDDDGDTGATEPLIPDAVEPCFPPVSSQSSDITAGSTLWMGEEISDSAKDATLTKESGEDWDDEPSVSLRADDEEEPACKYNYCFVQRSPFPLGYERSKTYF